MFLFHNQKKIFSLTILILQIIIVLINSSTTDFEMERVCSAGNFDDYEQKTGYRTAQHYADDDGMEITSAHPFYRSLFMTREKDNLNLFVKSIGFELFIVALGGFTFVNYIVFIIVWSVHKGMFRILSEKEKAEKQQTKCKYCKFFLMFLFLLISSALSVFGIIFMKAFKNSINLSDCGYLHFTNHGLFGDNQNFAGTYNLREAFANYTYSLNSIDNFYSRMNLFNNNISSINQEFNERLTDCNTLVTVNSVISPNPDKGLFDFISTNYQSIYGPYTNDSTILGIIYKYYDERIVPVLDALEEIKGDYRHFLQYKQDYITEIEKYSIYFDIMTQMYQILNNNIGRVYNDYTDEGVNTVYYLMYIIYIAFPATTLTIIVLIFIYVCKKEVGICIAKYIRIIIHVLWNILFVFTTLGFLLSGYIGTYRRYSYDLAPSFNYLISSGLIQNPNSEENIFQDFAGNSTISRSVKLFAACYNSSQSTNIANILDITDNLLLYFNKLYQDYNTLLHYIYNNNLNEDLSPYISDKEALINTFLFNISKATSANTHRENDISRYFAIVNRYTDFGNDDTYQIDCVTKMYDYWTTNRENCPDEYVYTLDGSHDKNCLVITDSEWTENMIRLRYLPICRLKGSGGSTGDQIDKYLSRIKKFYESNKQLIINMENGIDLLLDKYQELINSFNTEMRLDNNTFLNFTLPFSKFTFEEDIYNVFDCGILRQDLIDFYHIVRSKLNSICIAHLVLLLLLCIFNVAGIYFLITVLYTFYRKETKPGKKKTSSSSRNSDGKVLTINKSKKKTTRRDKKDNTKGKTKSKLYVSMGKNASSETPTSSSNENLRSSSGENETSQNEEEEESEEKTKNSRTSSYQSSSKSKQRSSQKSGSGSGSNSKSKSYESEKENKKRKKRKKKEEEEEEEEEEEIESGVRDDGSAMS